MTSLGPGDFTVAPWVGGLFTGTAGQTSAPRTGLGLWQDGTAYARLPLAGTGADDAQVVVEAGADRCAGGPALVVWADGVEVLRQVVDVEHGDYLLAGRYPHGVRALSVSLVGDHRAAGCDRALKLYGVRVAPGWQTADLTLGPSWTYAEPASSSYVRQVDGGAEQVVQATGTVSRWFTAPELRRAVVRVDRTGHWPAGTWCAAHPPAVSVLLDRHVVGALHPTSTGRAPGDPLDGAYEGGRGWEGLPLSPLLAAGPHLLQLAVTMAPAPVGETCGRSVGVFRLTLAAAPV